MSTSINDDLMSGGKLQAALFSTDASGNVTGLVGPNGVLRLTRRKPQIGFMPTGICSGSRSAATSTGNPTAFLGKYALPVLNHEDVVGVQVVIQQPYDASGGTTIYSAVVAATETAMETDETTLYHPVKGGAAVDALDSTSDAYGWFSVTWAGAATVTPSLGSSADNPAFAVSDVIPITLIERDPNDTTAGAYTPWPLLMVRVKATDGEGTGYWNYRTMMEAASAEAATENNRGLLCQGFFVKSAASAGYVDAPQTNSPPGSALNATMMTVGFILHLRHGGISAMWFGDSTVEMNAVDDNSNSGVDNAGLNMAARIAETGIPCGWINRGRSSGTSAIYNQNIASALAAFSPDVVIFQAFTHNDNPYNTEALMRYKTRLLAGRSADCARQASAIGATFLVSSGFPGTSGAIGTAAVDAIRAAHIQSYAPGEDCRVQLLDTCSVVSDGASPERWVAGNVYDNADDIHPKSAGVRALGEYCAATIIKALAV